VQGFQGGTVYWSSETGPRVVEGAILKAYRDAGAENSELGYPTSDEIALTDGGAFSRFQGGAVYWSPDTGAHVVRRGPVFEGWGLPPLAGRRRVLVAGHRRPGGPARSRVRGVGHRRLRAWPPRLPDERRADDPRGAGHGVRGRTDHGGQRRGGDLVTPRNAGRTAALAAALLMAGGTLAACGGGDSTVSGVPDSESVAPPPGGAETTSSRAPATEDSGRFTEAPAPVSPDSPGYDTPVVGARERGYLAALEEEGVQTGELSESLVAAGNTI